VSLVAGVDSSTQSCKVVIRDAGTGELVRSGSASHPDGTEIHPDHWWTALEQAAAAAGGLGPESGVDAVAVGGQQHGMVCLDESGEVVRPALLWNDTRSAPAAAALTAELGAEAWAEAVGSVLVASFTATKLRWLAEHEPDHAARTAGVCLPHDWLTWRLAGAPGLDALVTDRSDASGTGYWGRDGYRRDLLGRAFGRDDLVLPRVLGPAEAAGKAGSAVASGALLGPGCGDNAGAALGLGGRPGDVIVSIGTSGVASAVVEHPVADATGTVAGFADATGRYLPLIATLNAARVLAATASMLRVSLDELSDLALSAPSGAGGLVLVPYLEGERTPDRPNATGAVHGLTLATADAAHLARAAVEGLLCGLADGIDALVAQGVRVERVLLIGGGARSEAVRRIAPVVLGREVVVPPPGEYVADGAARQAAWVLAGGAEPPAWSGTAGGVSRRGAERPTPETYAADPDPAVRARYAEVRDLTEG